MTTTSPARPQSRFKVIARRLLTIPAYLLLAALVILGFPLWSLATALIDTISAPRGSWVRTRALCFFALYLGAEVIGIMLAALLWLLTLGGRLTSDSTYLHANAAIQRWWTDLLLQSAKTCFSLSFEVDGIEQTKRAPFVLFVRHSSTADTVLAAALVANPNKLVLRYVLKKELLWDPCLDIVGRRLPNAFVDRGATHMDAEVSAIVRLTRNLDTESAALIYPEGTRFTPQKLDRYRRQLRERGKDRLADIADGFRHVLPPRIKGPTAMLTHAPDVDVIFLQQAGFEGVESFGSFWQGDLVGRTIWVRFRRFEANTVPDEKQDEWLFERWAEIDEWIHQLPQPVHEVT